MKPDQPDRQCTLDEKDLHEPLVNLTSKYVTV
jgi:hypothetical protein